MPQSYTPRGTSLLFRLVVLAQNDPGVMDRSLNEFMRRPWLRDELDPFHNGILGRSVVSADIIMCVGIAMDDWPGWLIYGEGDAPPYAGFLRLLYHRLSLIDQGEIDGPVISWLKRRLHENFAVTFKEVDSWFTGFVTPRDEVYPDLKALLGFDSDDLKRALSWVEPRNIDISDMRKGPAGQINGTFRFPIGSAPEHDRYFQTEWINGPLNPQRIIRILSDSSELNVDPRIIARWRRHEITPSPLELMLINESIPRDPALSAQYRREVLTARRVMKLANELKAIRGRVTLNFRERTAIALDVCGLVQLRSSRDDRLCAISSMGIDRNSDWLTVDTLASDDEIDILAAETGCHRRWFTEAVASPHSVLA